MRRSFLLVALACMLAVAAFAPLVSATPATAAQLHNSMQSTHSQTIMHACTVGAQLRDTTGKHVTLVRCVTPLCLQPRLLCSYSPTAFFYTVNGHVCLKF
jgi:hypothetical protein